MVLDMENSETEETPEAAEAPKNVGGRPSIPNLTTKLCHLDADDLEEFKRRYKGRVREDGTKDSVDAALRRLMRSHLEELAKEELWAQQKEKSS